MIPQDLEQCYEALALKLDQVGEEHCQLYLAKLALLMANQLGDIEIVNQCIEEAAVSLGQKQ